MKHKTDSLLFFPHSGFDVEKRRLGPHEDGGKCHLQHGRAGEQHHFVKRKSTRWFWYAGAWGLTG